MNYKVRNWEEAQRIRDKIIGGYGDHKEEHALYEELLGRYYELPKSGRSSQKTYWEPFNKILDMFIGNGKDYARFRYEPFWDDRTGIVPNFYADLSVVKSQLHAALKRIASDYGFIDPSHQISEHKKEHGMQINNTNNNNQNQAVDQHNTQNTSIGINIQELEEALGETLSDEQLAEIKPKIDKFASEPKKWINAESLIKGALGFGKEAGLLVLRAVLDKYIP